MYDKVPVYLRSEEAIKEANAVHKLAADLALSNELPVVQALYSIRITRDEFIKPLHYDRALALLWCCLHFNYLDFTKPQTDIQKAKFDLEIQYIKNGTHTDHLERNFVQDFPTELKKISKSLGL